MKISYKMKHLKPLLLIITFIMSSCYIYRPYTGEEEIVENTSSKHRALSAPTSLRASMSATSDASIPTLGRDGVDPDKEKSLEALRQKEEENKKINEELMRSGQLRTVGNNNQTQTDIGEDLAEKEKINQINLEQGIELELTLKQMLKPNKHYKITVNENRYKVQVDKWEGDTLISHIIRKPEKVLKFHENQINTEEVLERKFSKPMSDMITIGSYVAIGATVLLLLL